MSRIAALLVIGFILAALPCLRLLDTYIDLGGTEPECYMLSAAADKELLIKKVEQYGLGRAYIQQSPGAFSLVVDAPDKREISSACALARSLRLEGIFVTEELSGRAETGTDLLKHLENAQAREAEEYREKGLQAVTMQLPYADFGIGFDCQAAKRGNWLAVGMPALTQGY